MCLFSGSATKRRACIQTQCVYFLVVRYTKEAQTDQVQNTQQQYKNTKSISAEPVFKHKVFVFW